MRLDKEIREIDISLKLSQKRDHFDFKKSHSLRVEDLQQALLDHEPQIVHFSGHGSTEGLLVENQLGQAQQVNKKALANLFELFSDSIQCVVLNSCNSEAVAEEIARSIAYAVGMNDEIKDEAAIQFAIGFYKALGAGKDYEFAFKFACNAIELSNLPGKDIPVLKKGNPEAIQKSLPPTGPQSTVPDQQQIAPQFTVLLSEHISSELDEVTQLYYAGKFKTALEQLLTIKQDQIRWSALENDKKAQVLRIEANLLLSYDSNIDLAQQRSDEADRISPPPPGSSALQALITWSKSGPQQALPYLESPVAAEGKLLKAWLLSALERFEEADNLLEGLPEHDSAIQSDVFRLRAIIKLYDRELDSALLCIQRARKRTPDSNKVIETEGMLLYYSALSPAVVPQQLQGIPDPVDWLVVRHDLQSLERLNQAAENFCTLLDTCETNQEQQRSWEVWRLACLSCHKDRLPEAETYCRHLLDKEPTHAYAIAWGIVRRFLNQQHITKCIFALEEQLTTEKPKIGAILSLCALYREEEQDDKACSLLETHQDIFIQQNQLPLWQAWKAQASCVSTDTESEVSTEADLSIGAKLIYLKQAATINNDYKELFRYAEQSLHGELSLDIFLNICVFLSYQNEWNFIADHALELAKKGGTSGAVELAAQACYETNRYKELLKILTEYTSLFSEGKLPPGLERVKIMAQQRVGGSELPKAVLAAEALAQQTGELIDLLRLADLQLYQGNIAQATHTILQAGQQHKLPPEHIIHYSQVIAPENKEAAVKLLTSCKPEELPSELLPAVYMLSNTLGVEDKLEQFLSRFHEELAAGMIPGVQKFTGTDKLIELIQSSHQQAQQRQQLYEQGKTPIHLIADQAAHSPLLSLYHEYLSYMEQDGELAGSSSLFVRHGGRTIIRDFPAQPSEWNLHLDITALLLSAHLGILNKVEQCFSTLHIPALLMPLLQNMLQRTESVQASRVKAMQKILLNVENGRVEVLQTTSSLKNHLFSLNALFLDWTNPPNDDDQLPDELRINCRYLAEALFHLGQLSQVTFEDAVSRLGEEGTRCICHENISEEQHVICQYGIAIVLAEAGLWEAFTRSCYVLLQEEDIVHLRNEMRSAEVARKNIKWLKIIRNQLSYGIKNGNYQILPIPSGEQNKEVQRCIDAGELNTACVFSLFSVPKEEQAQIWCDDRFVSAYPLLNGHPTVTIFDILKALKEYNYLTEKEYYATLQTVRKSNIRFIPLEADEILYWLRNAPVASGMVKETPELCVLRRYSAICLGDASGLQPQTEAAASNPNGELFFIAQHNLAAINAIMATWDSPDEHADNAIAWSDWILHNLYSEYYEPAPAWVQTNSDFQRFLSFWYAAFLTNAISLSQKETNDKASRRSRYLAWLSERLLDRRIETVVELRTEVATKFCSSIKSFLRFNDDTEAETGVKVQELHRETQRFLRQFVRECPELIREQLYTSQEMRELLGLAGNDKDALISLGSYHFSIKNFNKAVAKATKKKKGKICTWNKEHRFSVTLQQAPKERKNPILHFKNIDRQLSFYLDSPENAVLLPAASERTQFLKRQAGLFDLPKQQQTKEFAKIKEQRTPWGRVKATSELLQDSNIYFYQQFVESIRERRSFKISDLLPPSGNSMLRFLRLEDKEEIQVELCQAAQRMIKDTGIKETLLRFFTLPCPLPSPIGHHLSKLSTKQRDRLFAEWQTEISSPLSLFHYLRVVSQYQNRYQEKASKLLEDFLTDPDRDRVVQFFLLLVNLMKNLFSTWHETRELRPATRLALAWSHADRILAVFISLGKPDEGVLQYFRENGQHSSPADFQEESRNGIDIADPKVLPHDFFILQALSFALDETDSKLLTKKTCEEIAKLCILEAENVETTLPNLLLLRDTLLAKNELNAFLQYNFKKIFEEISHSELTQWCSQDSQKKIITDAIRNEGLPFLTAWLSVESVLPYYRVHNDLKDELVSWLTKISLFELWESDAKLAQRIILQLALFAQHLKSIHLKEKVEKELITFAEILHKSSSTAEVESLEDILLDSCLRLALFDGTEAGFTENTVRLFKGVADVHPTLGKKMRVFYLPGLAEELLMESSRKFWSFIMNLRAME